MEWYRQGSDLPQSHRLLGVIIKHVSAEDEHDRYKKFYNFVFDLYVVWLLVFWRNVLNVSNFYIKCKSILNKGGLFPFCFSLFCLSRYKSRFFFNHVCHFINTQFSVFYWNFIWWTITRWMKLYIVTNTFFK